MSPARKYTTFVFVRMWALVQMFSVARQWEKVHGLGSGWPTLSTSDSSYMIWEPWFLFIKHRDSTWSEGLWRRRWDYAHLRQPLSLSQLRGRLGRYTSFPSWGRTGPLGFFSSFHVVLTKRFTLTTHHYQPGMLNDFGWHSFTPTPQKKWIAVSKDGKVLPKTSQPKMHQVLIFRGLQTLLIFPTWSRRQVLNAGETWSQARTYQLLTLGLSFLRIQNAIRGEKDFSGGQRGRPLWRSCHMDWMMPACNGRDHLKEIASVLLLDFLGWRERWRLPGGWPLPRSIT